MENADEKNVELEILSDQELKEYIHDNFTVDKDSAKGILLAAVLSSSEIGITEKGKNLTFSFKNPLAAVVFVKALKVRRKYSPELTMEIPSDGRRSRKLTAEIPEYHALSLLVDIGLATVNERGVFKNFNMEFSLSEQTRSGFFAELYLETGKLTCYEDYRLELALPDMNKCEKVAELLKEMGIKTGVKENNTLLLRTTSIYLYVALCGAHKQALLISEYYVRRETTAQLARKSNFETANTDKTISAAAYQCWAIQTLREAKKLSLLSADRLALALLREKNQEASLGELASMLGISKSTAFHRMKAITDLAEEYRK
ncbi:MAG: DNA-binding protein WhiA [Clostridia bacterium]|nr:DNA-binding protein WhiA [Clostridia bacterium]